MAAHWNARVHVGVERAVLDERIGYRPRVWLHGAARYDVNGTLDKPETLIASLEAQAHPRHVEELVAGMETKREGIERRLVDLRRELAKPFEYGDALEQLRQRRDAIVAELHLRDDGDRIVEAPESRGLAADVARTPIEGPEVER